MKSLAELSKTELLSLMGQEFNTDRVKRSCECATCGETDKAEFYYICDQCEADNAED